MDLNIIKKLEAARSKVTKLEQAISEKRNRELAGLPAQYGFDSLNSFIKAVRAASGGKISKSASSSKSGRRSRAVITDETKENVKKLVAAGKTGSEISEQLGISLPSVQNIKKELGLVKARKE